MGEEGEPSRGTKGAVAGVGVAGPGLGGEEEAPGAEELVLVAGEFGGGELGAEVANEFNFSGCGEAVGRERATSRRGTELVWAGTSIS